MYLYTTYVISAYHHLRGEFESSSGELYSIQHRVTCGRSVDSSTNKTDHHDIAEILLKVALDTITITQVVHDIILFINSSSKTYTPSRISSTRLYTSSSCSCYSCARLCSFHNNNGSATSPKTKWSFSHVGYKVCSVNHIGASLNCQLWILSLGCFRVSLCNRGPTRWQSEINLSMIEVFPLQISPHNLLKLGHIQNFNSIWAMFVFDWKRSKWLVSLSLRQNDSQPRMIF